MLADPLQTTSTLSEEKEEITDRETTYFSLNFFKDTLFVLLYTLASFAIPYFLNVLLARHLPLSDYGDLAVILGLLIFLFLLFHPVLK